jgi:rSAM/selenodomain-associated transferase 1
MTARSAEAARLVVLAKAPVAGAVKTRLIPALGAEGAAALHRKLVRHALQTAVASALGPVELCCAPGPDHPFFTRCQEDFALGLTAQVPGDLGSRMAAAFDRVMPSGPTILTGSDCPSLTVEDLRAAARALAQGRDAVFAPTEDGGYALIGLRAVEPALFEDIPWSTDSVMEMTRERMRDLDWTWKELPVRWDVDRPEDFRRLATDPVLGHLCDRISRPTSGPRLRAVS